MRKAVPLLLLLVASLATAQDDPVATDVTSADIQKFINELPRDRVSDRPIRVVDVTDDYRVGVGDIVTENHRAKCGPYTFRWRQVFNGDGHSMQWSQ